MTKKKIIIIIITIALGIIVIIGTVYILATVNNNKNSSQANPNAITKSQADTLNTQAAIAFKNNDLAKAKTLLEQAQTKYKTINDTNGIVDTAGQLSIIKSVLSTAPKAITTPSVTTK